MMPPGTRALAFAARWFDPAVVSRVFEPLVADWQREWRDAPGIQRRAASFRGFAAFMCAVLVSSPRILRQPTPSAISNRAVARIARFSIGATILFSLPYVWELGPWGPGLLFIFPSTLALVFPFAMIAAVDAIRGDHAVPPHVGRAAVVKLAMTAMVFMVFLGGFVTPASNQAFRAAGYKHSLRLQGVDEARIARITPGRDLPRRGLRELNTYELLTDHGFSDGTRYLRSSVGQELSNRASLAVLPAVLLWLRWSLLDLPRRRWWPLPPTVVAIAAFVGFMLLRACDPMIEGGLGLARGAGAWSPLVIISLLLGVDAWRRSRKGVIA